MVPTSLVEAERNGAMLVQNLAELETSSTTGKHDSSSKDSTDSNKKKANGHKEEGLFTCFLLIDTHLAPAYVSHKPDVCAMYCVNSMSICVTVLHLPVCMSVPISVCWTVCVSAGLPAFALFLYLFVHFLCLLAHLLVHFLCLLVLL